MSGLLINAVHLENTDGNSDKFYRILTVDGSWLATVYGPRGRAGTAEITQNYSAASALDNLTWDKRNRGYREIATLRYTTALSHEVATSDAAALSAEFDQQWHTREEATVRALTAAAGEPDDRPHLVILPTFHPRRGKVGGHRDSRPWGRALEQTLQHLEYRPETRDTYATVNGSVAAWIARNYPGANTSALPAGTDAGALLRTVVELTSVRGIGDLATQVNVAAAILA